MKEDPMNKRIKNSKAIKNLFVDEIIFLKNIQNKNGIYFDIKIVGSVPRGTANKDSDYDIQIILEGTKEKKKISANLITNQLIKHRGYTKKKEKSETCQVFEAFTKKVDNTSIDLSIHYCKPEIDKKWNINPVIPEDIKDIIYCTNQAIKKYNPKQKCATHKDIVINAGEYKGLHIKERKKI